MTLCREFGTSAIALNTLRQSILRQYSVALFGLARNRSRKGISAATGHWISANCFGNEPPVPVA
jgi:hypothetical protein